MKIKKNWLDSKKTYSHYSELKQQNKPKDLFDTVERSGQSFDEKSMESSNKNKTAGTNNWCLTQNCCIKDREIDALCCKGIAALD